MGAKVVTRPLKSPEEKTALEVLNIIKDLARLSREKKKTGNE